MNIIFDKLVVKYKEKEIRVNNRFVLKPGINIISAPNGTGKTTLLNCIYKKQKYIGEIIIDGKELGTYSKRAISQKFSYISQANMLLDELTPHEHVKLLNVDKQEFDQYIAAVNKLKIVNKPIKNLSGGEKQMINLFLGLSKKSEYILIDEPLNNISVINKQRILDILSESDKSMIVISHQLIDIEANHIQFTGEELIYV